VASADRPVAVSGGRLARAAPCRARAASSRAATPALAQFPPPGVYACTDATGAAVGELNLFTAGDYTWVAAAVGSNSAAGYQLATEEPVMAIGGFNGSDPTPTLAQFQAYVAAGDIHYFIASGGFGGQMGGSNDSSQIAAWVEANFTAQTIGNTTVYDLTAAS